MVNQDNTVLKEKRKNLFAFGVNTPELYFNASYFNISHFWLNDCYFSRTEYFVRTSLF
jgi:hypothetical protein